MKACPFCAEEIQDAALKCKHCGSSLTVSQYRDESLVGAMAIAVYLFFGFALLGFAAQGGEGAVVLVLANGLLWGGITAGVCRRYGKPVRGFLLGLILGPIGLLIAVVQK